MTRYTVKNTPESLLFWQSFLLWLRAAWLRLLLTSHSGEELTAEINPRCTCISVKVPAMLLCCTMLRQSHLSKKTPEQSSKAIQKKAFISTSEQSWPIIEEYLAVGCGFLVQTRSSCHLKSGDSRTTPICQLKLVWKKNPKCQHKNYGKWLRVLQHRPALTCELWEREIQSRRCYT